MTHYAGLWRVKATVFVVLIAVAGCAAIAVNLWGRKLALAVYRPYLEKTIAAQLDKGSYGTAEAMLLTALQASPEYAPVVLDSTCDYLQIMPELAWALENTLQTTAKHETVSAKTAIDLARVRLLRNEFDAVASMKAPAGMGQDESAVWSLVMVRCAARAGLALRLRESNIPSALSVGASTMPPEFRDELAMYEAMRTAMNVGATSAMDTHKIYLDWVVATELGERETLKNPISNIAFTASDYSDLCFRRGEIAEAAGHGSEARWLYAEAIKANEAHLGAAKALIRLGK